MKIDRLMSIILVLLDNERISAQQLANMFEVSLRTIYRDIDAIDLAGIPIRSTSGVGGGFEIMPNYKMDKSVFSTADLSAILMGLSSLSNMIQTDELMHALAKVKHFIPVERANEIELKMNQICIDLSQWMGNTNIQPYLEIMKVSLQENRLLMFEYVALHGNKTRRTIEPCQPVLKSSQWYIYGYCFKRNDFRLFRLSRMMQLHILEESFTPREYPKPQLEFSEGSKPIQTRIKIRIHPSIMDRVLDYCSYENFSPDGEGYYIVDYPFIENDYYYDLLLSFGSHCECLGPVHIRDKIKDRLHDIATLYKN